MTSFGWLIVVLCLLQEDTALSNISMEARRLLDEGDLNAALVLLEDHVQANPEDSRAWGVLGDAHRRVAEDWLIHGSDPTAPLLDARNAYLRALEGEPGEFTVFSLLTTLLELGRWSEAEREASKEIGRSLLNSGEAPGWLLELALQVKTRQLQARNPAQPADFVAGFEAAWQAVQNARSLKDTAEVVLQGCNLLQWAGQFAAAAALTREALQEMPAAEGLHRRLIDLHFYQGVVELLPPFYHSLAEQAPEEAIVLWYQAYVQLLQGDVARKELRLYDAHNFYAICGQQMQRAAGLEPGYASSAIRITFLARLGQAWCALREGKLAAAASRCRELLDEHAEHLHMADGLGRSLLDAIGRLEADAVAATQFAPGLELARKVAEVVGDDAQWYNNLGFMLREHATLVEGGAFAEIAEPRAAGRQRFEESWQAYQRAAELAPEDARIVNDAALIQAYHLRTELPKAQEMFHHSIRCGEEQLLELGENPAENERFPVAQAVGDAYQNLGYLYYHVYNEPAKALQFMQQSMATDSGSRPMVEAYIETLEGRGEAIEDSFDQPRATTAPQPNPLRAQLRWEPSFEAGLHRAEQENRPLFVYYRGFGQGDFVQFLDPAIRQPSLARALEEAVCVAADPQQYTYVERRSDGSAVHSPLFASITCSEHVLSAEQFNAWWGEHRTEEDLTVPEERFYYFTPQGELFRTDVFARVSESLATITAAAGEPRPDRRIPHLHDQLLEVASQRRDLAAIELLKTPGSLARDLVENLLLDQDTPAATRDALLFALRPSSSAYHRALWNGLARQFKDAELAELAVRHWPESMDDLSLVYALQWSPHRPVRAQAVQTLAQRAGGWTQLRPLLARLIHADESDRVDTARALGQQREAILAILIQRLQSETAAAVRVALCEALAGSTDEAVNSALQTLAEKDDSRAVRAAARHSIRR